MPQSFNVPLLFRSTLCNHDAFSLPIFHFCFASTNGRINYGAGRGSVNGFFSEIFHFGMIQSLLAFFPGFFSGKILYNGSSHKPSDSFDFAVPFSIAPSFFFVARE